MRVGYRWLLIMPKACTHTGWHGQTRASSVVLAGDRVSPVLAKASVGHADPHRRLATLVLVDADQPHHFVDIGFGKAIGHDAGRTLVVLHVALDDGVEHIVFGQAVLVLLVGPQFGAGRAGDDALGHRVGPGAIRVVLIAPARQAEHHGLGHAPLFPPTHPPPPPAAGRN